MAEPLTLKEAREYIDKAIALCEEFGWRTSWSVTDEGGNVISISRMDDAPVLGPAVSRAKAHLSAVTRGETGGFSARMNKAGERWMAYMNLMKEHGFPGPGGCPIIKEGQCVGGFSMSIMSRLPGGKEPPTIDGGRVNLEDYIACEALGVPYHNQH